MKKTLGDLRLEVAHTIFYEEDFKSKNLFEYWKKEFEKASCYATQLLIEWAKGMLDYLDDFEDSVYYLRDEIEELLNQIISCDPR